MACSSADWVRGLARLISSAINRCAKTGPERKRKLRLPAWLSSSTSVPRMSDGIKSGVNWMRRASSPTTVPIVSSTLGLASPGENGDDRLLDDLILAENHRADGSLGRAHVIGARLGRAHDHVFKLFKPVSADSGHGSTPIFQAAIASESDSVRGHEQN